MSETKTVFTADQIADGSFRFGHPLEDDAEVTIAMIGRIAGMNRTGLNLVRVAPGRKAFPLHRHMAEEEWTYVLSGQAEVTIGDRTERLGPGSFVFFPPGRAAHQVANGGDDELVCLMGGENLPYDTVDFPAHGKRLTRTPAGAELGAADSFAPFDFFARTPLPVGTE